MLKFISENILQNFINISSNDMDLYVWGRNKAAVDYINSLMMNKPQQKLLALE